MNEYTTDRLLNGRVTLQQKAGGFRAAVDAVLLAASCPASAGTRVLDAGCGAGTAGLCVMARTGCEVSGIDIQRDFAELAQANARLNGFGAYAAFTGSVANPPGEIAGSLFDHAICNPPYLPTGYGNAPDRLETHESHGVTLADWVAFCTRRVRNGGSVVFIHRADRLPELLAAMETGWGALTVFPLRPRHDQPAHRVIVGGIKGRRTPFRLLAGLDLHQVEGGFTEGADAILRDAQPIGLWTP